MQKIEIGDYLIPGDNAVALTDDLVETIKHHFDLDKDNRFQLFTLAAGIRRKYLKMPPGSRDPKRAFYAPEFESWYQDEKMGEQFGTLSNFTKYAAAGEVVAYTAKGGAGSGTKHAAKPEVYLRQLPVSLGALNEISGILGKNLKPTRSGKELFRQCFQHKMSRPYLDAEKHEWKFDSPALIRRHVSADEIRNWKRAWFDPPERKQKRVDKRTLTLGTITVSGELFDFDTRKNTAGEKTGCLDLDEVEAFLEKLKTLFTDENSLQFKLNYEDPSNPPEWGMNYLAEGYYKRQDRADPANRIEGKIDEFYGLNEREIADLKKKKSRRIKKKSKEKS
jgi:hypothetical protein